MRSLSLVLGSHIDSRSRLKVDLLLEVYSFYFLCLTGEIWPKGSQYLIDYHRTREIVYILFVCSCVCVSSVESYLLS